MTSEDTIVKYLGHLRSVHGLCYWHHIGPFGKSIYYHIDGVKPPSSLGELGNKVHGQVNPLISWNGELL